MKEVIKVDKQKKKPCETYQISYIKVTYDKDGKVISTTVKYVSRAQDKRK